MSELILSPKSRLLVIDIQERLLGAMPEQQMKRCLHTTRTLVELAGEMGAPIIYTEQYPKGLGPTEKSLLKALQKHNASRVEKNTFNACSAPTFHEHLIKLPGRIVVCGMETHICVHSTVHELIERRQKVVVPMDATVSRRPTYHENGLHMMEQRGATISNYETLVFNSLGSSRHKAFKKFSKLVR